MGPIVGGQAPGRNEPCPCGSGLKSKRCHFDEEKKSKAMTIAKKAYELEFNRLIADELARKQTSV